VWMGVYSQSFLPPVGRTTALVLEQSQVNVPLRVSMPSPDRRGAVAVEVAHVR